MRQSTKRRITTVFLFINAAVFALPTSERIRAQDPETVTDEDNDGLSDFQECYKYLTDPTQNDSDGDGVPDGDWRERREYQYIVRSVVHVLRPVTIEYLNDDYQTLEFSTKPIHMLNSKLFIIPSTQWLLQSKLMKIGGRRLS